MTPEQETLRTKAIEAIQCALELTLGFRPGHIWPAAAIFDSLHGEFTVNARDLTPAMIASAWNIFNRYPREKLTPGPGFKEALLAMSAAGDLTKAPT
jgi:hypothetical protein